HTRFSRDWSSDVCSSDLDRQRNSTVPFPSPELRTTLFEPGSSSHHTLSSERRANWLEVPPTRTHRRAGWASITSDSPSPRDPSHVTFPPGPTMLGWSHGP